MSNTETGHAQERAGTTQQGNTFVPGRESRQSRANRVNTAIQAVDRQFPNAQQQGHAHEAPGASRNGSGADLNGVGQQFHGYTRH